MNGCGLLSIPDKYLLDFTQRLTAFYETNDYSKLNAFLYESCIEGMAMENAVIMQQRGDGLDKYRAGHNQMLYKLTACSHNTIQQKYIISTVPRRSVAEARVFFKRVGLDLEKGFARLSSKAVSLSLHERLEVLHDFNRDRSGDFSFDLKRAMRRGHEFRASIIPESIIFKGNYFQLGEQFGAYCFWPIMPATSKTA